VRVVRHGETFSRDVGAIVERLAEQQEWSWVEKLGDDLEHLERIISAFPAAGRSLAARGTRELRKLRLRRCPFVVWYLWEPASPEGPVSLVRMFHVRQWTPAPRI
jgi:plasmid stabilization system protein ParE